MILPILFIVATLVSYLWAIPWMQRRPAVLSLAEVAEAFDAAQAGRELSRPLADIIAEAERKAIAMHSPLAGDPHQAKVVANRPDPTWNGHAPEPPSPIEITAFGDRDRSFIHVPTTTNTTHYYTGCGGRERDPDSVMAGGGGGTGTTRVAPAYIRNPLNSLRDERLATWHRCKMLVEPAREFSRSEQQQWDLLNEMLNQLDLRIAYYQKLADSS